MNLARRTRYPSLWCKAAILRQCCARRKRCCPLLDRLATDKVFGGVEIAARYLPSVATQRARQANLPPPDVLATQIAAAEAELPFRNGAFQNFVADVIASRTMAPLRLSDITSPLIAARLQPLLFRRGQDWYGLIAPSDLSAPERFAAAMRDAGATFVDVDARGEQFVAVYTATAWRWLRIGAVAALAAVAIGLRDVRRTITVIGALAGAVVVTVSILSAIGTRLSLIHIVSLQFVAGVGLDYALFFARRQLDEEERARTLRTLITCNAMTLLTFGLLAFCAARRYCADWQTVAIGACRRWYSPFCFVGANAPRHTRRADATAS